MDAKQFAEKWEGISAQADEAAPLAYVVARFGGFEEVQVQIPRRSLFEMRRDVLSVGGAMVASFV